MTIRPIAMGLSAAALGLFCLPALAQTAETPAAKHEAAPKKPHAKKPAKAAKAASGTPAATAVHPSLLGNDDENTSLERRRKAFFAAPADEGGSEPDAPTAGVTLGGSGGITPGMGMKF